MPSMRTLFVIIVVVLITVFLLAEYQLVNTGMYRFREEVPDLATRGAIVVTDAAPVHVSTAVIRNVFSASSTPVTRAMDGITSSPKDMDLDLGSLSTRNATSLNRTHIMSQYPGKTVAMGCAITTRKIPSAKDMIKSLPFFKHLLPSFCKTASPGYFYVFYMGFDFNDPILSAPAGREMFLKFFNLVTTNQCKGNYKVDVQFVKCNHSAKPAWAQNDALLAGYNDGMEYFYMINDDTIMTTNQWTNAFIQQLAKFNPPNVGLVGPRHSGGNVAILTYHFTHRTHIDIFHYFYPRNFTDWFGDDWITHIYEPNNVKKMLNILVKHTLEKGQRYKHHAAIRSQLKGVLAAESKTLQRYLESRGVDWAKWSYKPPAPKKPSPKKAKKG